jgi:hypothetical protein
MCSSWENNSIYYCKCVYRRCRMGPRPCIGDDYQISPSCNQGPVPGNLSVVRLFGELIYMAAGK